jgi:hypothetical protein
MTMISAWARIENTLAKGSNPVSSSGESTSEPIDPGMGRMVFVHVSPSGIAKGTLGSAPFPRLAEFVGLGNRGMRDCATPNS